MDTLLRYSIYGGNGGWRILRIRGPVLKDRFCDKSNSTEELAKSSIVINLLPINKVNILRSYILQLTFQSFSGTKRQALQSMENCLSRFL